MRRPTAAPAALLALLLSLVSASGAFAASPAAHVLATGLPDPALTPGVYNPNVTQATIHATICTSGWTATIRPPASYTEALKRSQIARYGYADRRLGDFEEDHLVPLELGGAPRDPGNLWPQPHHVSVNGRDAGSYAKDAFENRLKALVCAGRLSLSSARAEIRLNWVKYRQRWMGT